MGRQSWSIYFAAPSGQKQMRPRRLVLGWFFPGNFGLLGKNRISFCFDLFLIEMDCIPTVTSDSCQLLHQNNYQNMSYLYTLRQFNIAMENVHVSQVDHLLSWVIFHSFHGYQRIRIPSIPKLMVNHHVPQSPHQNCAINWGIHCIHLFFLLAFPSSSVQDGAGTESWESAVFRHGSTNPSWGHVLQRVVNHCRICRGGSSKMVLYFFYFVIFYLSIGMFALSIRNGAPALSIKCWFLTITT